MESPLDEGPMKVGFIGLGAMGAPMAERVVKAGFETFTTFHKRREAADSLVAMGATLLASPAEVARAADTVITILPADAELKDTVFGWGLLEGFSAGKVLIDMTTATAITLQEIAAVLTPLGVRVLDAPVSGGTTAAANGTLTIMVGGDASLLEECRPLLESMGSRIIHAGPLGQGKVVKIVNQMMAAVNLLAIGEAFAFGIRSGASPDTLYSVIKESSGYSKMMDLAVARLSPGRLLSTRVQAGPDEKRRQPRSRFGPGAGYPAAAHRHGLAGVRGGQYGRKGQARISRRQRSSWPIWLVSS